MSQVAIDWVLRGDNGRCQPIAPSSSVTVCSCRVLLQYLAFEADDDGLVTVTVDDLAYWTRSDREQVRARLRHLADSGVIDSSGDRHRLRLWRRP